MTKLKEAIVKLASMIDSYVFKVNKF